VNIRDFTNLNIRELLGFPRGADEKARAKQLVIKERLRGQLKGKRNRTSRKGETRVKNEKKKNYDVDQLLIRVSKLKIS
jgi:hypothetical protein